MGLGRKRRSVLESEDELSVLMDFALYEIPLKGKKSLVELYAEERGGANLSKENFWQLW